MTFDPNGLTVLPTQTAPAANPDEALQQDWERLSPEEKQLVESYAEQIDVTDAGAVLQYGSAAQTRVSDFSDSALKNVRSKDMGEAGEMLSKLVTELKGFGGDTPKTGFGVRRRIAAMKAGYGKVEANVDSICDTLEQHQAGLLKDIAVLDQLHAQDLAYYKELTMYILAGKKKLLSCRETELTALQQRAESSQLPEDATAANDYANMLNRLEKKLYDLELTRAICVQMSPQIRLLQNNDSLMVEKIQSSLVNTIPLWKNQMVLSLGLEHTRQAMEAQRAVTDLTNELLRKNAEMLHTASVDVAKESERGIVDLETLQETNRSLIDTLEDIRTVQVDGRQKRMDAEAELQRLEGELRTKLLELAAK